MGHGIFWTTSLCLTSSHTTLSFLCGLWPQQPSFWPSYALASFLPQGLCTCSSLLLEHLPWLLLPSGFISPHQQGLSQPHHSESRSPLLFSIMTTHLFLSTPSHFLYLCHSFGLVSTAYMRVGTVSVLLTAGPPGA